MKKILWLSDSPTTTTGYGTVTRNILNRLSDHYECHCLGHNYVGQTLKPPIKIEDGTELKFTLHGSGGEKYSVDKIQHLIRKLDIDIFGVLLDTFMAYDAGFLNIDTSPAKTFFYYPTDGGGRLPLMCENILKKVNYPVAMAKFGKLQVEKAHSIKSKYIPHGLDKKYFYPLSKKKKAEIRQKWKLENKFVVGVVARNQGRKMLDLTLKSFKLFCVNHPDAVLLMHSDPHDKAQSFNITDLINRLKLNNRIIFTGTTFFNPFGYDQMNEIYNLMDIFYLTTSGEGFGVPLVEAMACGVPQLATDYTTTNELVTEHPKSGESIKLAGRENSAPYPHTDEPINGTITGSWNVERGIASVTDAVEKLSFMYAQKKANSDIWKEYVNNSIEKSQWYEWDFIMPLWDVLFSEMTK